MQDFRNKWEFSDDAVVRHPPAIARDSGSIPGLGRSPGRANGNPFQYSCLENSVDRGAWHATVHGVARVRYDFMIEHACRNK